MPYIEAKVSSKVTEKQTLQLKERFGKAIECIPGKSESWLMVNIEDGKNLFFKGNNDAHTAFISVSIFGKATKSDYEALTRELSSIVSDILNIQKDRIYITYREVDTWGWNGSDF